MNYRNSEMKLDQLVSYLNEKKINLSPAFQRGHVWNIATRKKLIKNIVQGKPIPAIFLYKEASGAKYSYNILDGKQRLESLILFIGARNVNLSITNWSNYFYQAKDRRHINFDVELSEEQATFADLDESTVRDFREYAIPTVEISLSEDSSLDEIIELFVDINQQGSPVKRFDIVKAMTKNDPLLQYVFKLLAIEQKRQEDVLYRAKNVAFTSVLKKLKVVGNLNDANAQVDRMWERLLEIVLFYKTRKHRKPIEILKNFISRPSSKEQGLPSKLTVTEGQDLRSIFTFLRKAYKQSDLVNTRLAIDQTHFYIMITSLIDGDLLHDYENDELVGRLVKFGEILDGTRKLPRRKLLRASIKEYQDISAKQTTDISRRESRQRAFMTSIEAMY